MSAREGEKKVWTPIAIGRSILNAARRIYFSRAYRETLYVSLCSSFEIISAA